MIIRLLSPLGRSTLRTRTLLLLLALIVCLVTFQLAQLTQPLGSVTSFLKQVGSRNSGRASSPTRDWPNRVFEDAIWRDHPPPRPPTKVIHPPNPFAKVQFNFEKESLQDQKLRETRFKKIRNAFVHAWRGYRKYAFGADELKPISNQMANPVNGWGATIVDSLDTMLLFELTPFYLEALDHISDLNFTKSTTEISVFEVSIRYLGGLLGAYELEGDKLLLDQALSLADAILPAFETSSGLPTSRHSLGHAPQPFLRGSVTLAEAGTLSLEFTRLTQLTGDAKYYDAIQKVTNFFENYKDTQYPGLYPDFFEVDSGQASSQLYGFGAMSKSFYEYLLKEHILIGGSNHQYKALYIASVEALKKNFLKRANIPGRQEILFITQANQKTMENKMEHLACSLPAVLALGSKILSRPDDLRIAEGIAEGCVWAHHATVTGVSWDTWWFEEKNDDDDNFTVDKKADDVNTQLEKTQDDKVLINNQEQSNPKKRTIAAAKIGSLPKGITKVSSKYYMRPETLETLWYLYRITGNKKWQEHAWTIFQAITFHCRTESSFSALESVDNIPAPQLDKLGSYFFAGTLKYLGLIFSPIETFSLDEWVFGSEGHAFRRPSQEWMYAETARKRLFKNPSRVNKKS